MVKALWLDIGGVVLARPPQVWQQFLQPKIQDDAESIIFGANGPWSACKVGKISYREYMEAVAAPLGVNVEVLSPWLLTGAWKVNQPLVQWVRTAKARYALQVIAVSNADPMLEKRLSIFGVMDLFDVVVNSSRVQMAKPDPAIYRHVLNLTGTQPEECLFVDDQARNMPPAQELGIHTVVYTALEEFLGEVQRYFPIGPTHDAEVT